MNQLPFSFKRALLPMHWITVLTCLIGDQVIKYLIIFKVPRGASIEVLPFFEIVHIKNRGAAFGMFHDASPTFRLVFFGIVTIVALVWLVRELGMTAPESKGLRFALALILGGALGNVKDRVIFGEVTDFLHVFYKEFSWPAFNIADSCISVGVTIMLFLFAHQAWSSSKFAKTKSN